MSSCMKSSSSILASFLASGGRDSARRRSSMDSRTRFVCAPAVWHTSVMYSIRISSITFTVSLAGFRSSPKPYMRFFNSFVYEPRKLDCFRAPRPVAPSVAAAATLSRKCDGVYEENVLDLCGGFGVEVRVLAAGADRRWSRLCSGSLGLLGI
ncbi:hypothetical protein B0H14DRAFT_2897043, partial [Mycena olivaceomarginata]